MVPTGPSWGEEGDSPGWACQGQGGGPMKPSFGSEGHGVWHLALVSKAVATGPLGQVNVLSGHIRLCFSLLSQVLPPYFPLPYTLHSSNAEASRIYCVVLHLYACFVSSLWNAFTLFCYLANSY